MQKLLKVFGVSGAVFGLFAGFVGANAASPRDGYNVRAASNSGATQRMPSMPILPINTVGNVSTDLPTPGTTVLPNPEPNPNPNPDPDPKPNPDPECPDGGVKNSTYTVDSCMSDILSCIDSGALPGGINDLFNEDLRNSIMNGMNLCAAQVDTCITSVRRDCSNVYRTTADVWLDFNSRKIQPEYYSFVLRKTGLTPNQAENTCMLLDKNTYGSSFSAVANNGVVTSEYNNRVGAYNSQNGNSLVKGQPQGATVNNNNSGVDGQRGHYARWDATTAECWIRVAAYNKDSQIKNSWLFGAAGDDKPAEVWKVAGDTFTCNKDLFGFSLMKQTSTAAVVGVGGGTVLGVGIGAAAGHGDREFDCSNKSQVKELSEQLRTGGNIAILNEYLDSSNRISSTGGTLTKAQCEEIVKLNDVRYQLSTAMDNCKGGAGTTVTTVTVAGAEVNCSGYTDIEQCFNSVAELNACAGQGFTTLSQCAALLARNGVTTAQNTVTTTELAAGCSFHPINKAKEMGEGIYCTAGGSDCMSADDIRADLNRLSRVLDNLEILEGQESNMGKSIAIGAAAGAGAGGLATAITAFVERSNISCHVGDGLEQVGFGKSYSIGSLKDFYVKWNLRLPDTVAPTAQVTDCDTWKAACGTLNSSSQCNAAQINYKPAGANTVTLVKTACKMSGSTCIENTAVAKSRGACK